MGMRQVISHKTCSEREESDGNSEGKEQDVISGGVTGGGDLLRNCHAESQSLVTPTLWRWQQENVSVLALTSKS